MIHNETRIFQIHNEIRIFQIHNEIRIFQIHNEIRIFQIYMWICAVQIHNKIWTYLLYKKTKNSKKIEKNSIKLDKKLWILVFLVFFFDKNFVVKVEKPSKTKWVFLRFFFTVFVYHYGSLFEEDEKSWITVYSVFFRQKIFIKNWKNE